MGDRTKLSLPILVLEQIQILRNYICLLSIYCFFGDAGNGDQFAYPIQNGKIQRNDIFVWNHEDDSRTWVAPDLKYYIEWWLTGKLSI